VAKEELCALKVFREIWKMLEDASTLEEARKRFKELLLRLVLEE